MKIPYLTLIVTAVVYLLTGIYTVPANEKGVLRRFGKLVRPHRPSGLHFDLPWPFSQVDRANFNEARTLTLGDMEVDPNFLQSTSGSTPISFLTGDKNLLLLRMTVQYRLSDEHIEDWLYRSQSPVAHLQLVVEATVADLVARCGVDFVHTQGLAQLNNRLLHEIRMRSLQLKLGCDVEQVSIDRAEPPARVKPDFLDVSNARADMARIIHDARGYAEQHQAESQADAKRVYDHAQQDRNTAQSAAQGAADRFVRLVSQIEEDSIQSGHTYHESRQLVINRLTLETLREVLEKSKRKIVLDGEQRFDLALPK